VCQNVFANTHFALETPVTLYRAGVPWFSGKVSARPVRVSATDESYQVTASNAWRELSQLVFRQTWKAWNADYSAQIDKTTSHLFLGQDVNGVKFSVGAQIREIIAWARARGINIQCAATLGAIESVNPPIDEIRDTTCAECIQKMLRWCPDTVTWFDYSTPAPTIHFSRRSERGAVTLDITQRADVDLSVAPLIDRQCPSVALYYEITSQVDGISYRDIVEDIAPPLTTGLEVGAFVATIDLQGASSQSLSADVETAPIVETTTLYLPIGGTSSWTETWPDFFRRHNPWLSDPKVFSVELIGKPTRNLDKNEYPFELISGQVAPWMKTQINGQTITGKTAPDVVSVLAKITYQADGASTRDVQTVRLDTQIMATNLQTGKYSTLQSWESGDPIPTGLAASLYDAVKTLEWSGSIALVAQEVDATIPNPLNHLLNLSNGDPEWTSMAAQIQSVTEDIDNGKTSYEFGPPEHLGPSDLITLLQVNRRRQILTPMGARSDASITKTQTPLGNKFPTEANQTNALTRESMSVVKNDTLIQLDSSPTAPPTVDAKFTKQIQIRGSDLSDNDTASFREAKVCVDGVNWKTCKVLMTEPK
jgi:hypothetical protein